MSNLKATNLDQQLDDLLKDVNLPTDEQIRKETGVVKRLQNPKYRKKQKEGAQKRSQNPDYIKKLQNSRDKELSKKISTELHTNPTYKQNHKTGIDNFKNDTVKYQQWRNNVEAKRKNTTRAKYKPIQTPDGVFKCQTDAAAYYGIHKTSFRDRMKHNPTKYFEISKERYIELTGHNPWLS